MTSTARGMMVAGLLAVGVALFASGSAQAQHFGRSPYGHGHYGFKAPIYHPPSVHYHRVYHPTQLHWTPGRGLHTHGHYDHVPHYKPGHFDIYHNGHIHGNPRYHGHHHH